MSLTEEEGLFFVVNNIVMEDEKGKIETHKIPITQYSHSTYTDGQKIMTLREELRDKLAEDRSMHPLKEICNFPEVTLGFLEQDFKAAFEGGPFYSKVKALLKESEFGARLFGLPSLEKSFVCPVHTRKSLRRKIIPYPLLPYIIDKLPEELQLHNNPHMIYGKLLEQIIRFEDSSPFHKNSDLFKAYREQLTINYNDTVNRKDCDIITLKKQVKKLMGKNQFLIGELISMKQCNDQILEALESSQKRIETLENYVFGNKKRRMESEENNSNDSSQVSFSEGSSPLSPYNTPRKNDIPNAKKINNK